MYMQYTSTNIAAARQVAPQDTEAEERGFRPPDALGGARGGGGECGRELSGGNRREMGCFFGEEGVDVLLEGLVCESDALRAHLAVQNADIC